MIWVYVDIVYGIVEPLRGSYCSWRAVCHGLCPWLL